MILIRYIAQTNHQVHLILVMKKIFILFIGIAFLFSCTNHAKKNGTPGKQETSANKDTTGILSSQQKKGKFNGEYIQVPSKDTEKDRQMTLGSDYFSMGKVNFTLGSGNFSIKLFYKEGTVLTFSYNYINTFIQSSSGKKMHLHLTTSSANAVGTYIAKIHSTTPKTASLTLSYHQKKYTLISGKVKVISFSPKKAKLHITVDGKVKDSNGKIQSIKGVMDVSYGEAINLPSVS